MTRSYTAGNKKGNDYQEQLPQYDETPKAVIAASALSLAKQLQGEDDIDAAKKLIADEWESLHNAGIIPQAPKKEKPQKAGGIRPFMATYFGSHCQKEGIPFSNPEDGTVLIDENHKRQAVSALLWPLTLEAIVKRKAYRSPTPRMEPYSLMAPYLKVKAPPSSIS
jgi:hypothetical protein